MREGQTQREHFGHFFSTLSMALRIGDKAPDFTAETQKGEVNLYSYLGDSWGILCSHPADFTPVCTTELGDLAKRREAWERRNTKVLALSVDPPDSHTSWIKVYQDPHS